MKDRPGGRGREERDGGRPCLRSVPPCRSVCLPRPCPTSVPHHTHTSTPSTPFFPTPLHPYTLIPLPLHVDSSPPMHKPTACGDTGQTLSVSALSREPTHNCAIAQCAGFTLPSALCWRKAYGSYSQECKSFPPFHEVTRHPLDRCVATHGT
jgi:hypothetical protein